ncbi:MAG: tetratricopeptide repeat protein, partial [Actinophytocola sp.]|nr:tetratricopeptide repeat protein [Actinophytocola sp.]
ALVDAELVCAGARGFAPAHDLVSETVRDDLAPVDRARLHGLLAHALAGDRSASGERARHLAGAGDRTAAAAAYAVAARERLDHFANREAEQLAEQGLALDPDEQARADLLDVRAETRFRAGDPAAARSDLREALVLVPNGPVRARLLTKLASVLSGTDDLVHAANLVDLALTEAGDDPAARAKALTAGAIIDMNLEREQRSRERYDEALALFRQVGDARGVADILDGRAMAVFMAGEIDAAIDAFGQAAQLFADSGNLLRVVTPRSTRGHALLFAGRADDAVPDIAQALELAESLGYAEGEAFTRWHFSEALVALGRADDAVAMARRAVAVATRVGHRGWTATAHRALGITLAAAGDLADAEAAFRQMLEHSTHFPLFQCWAHARLALVLTDTGRLDEAAEHVDIAVVTGPPLGHYEARLAACALAVRRAQPDAPALVADAIRHAESGGHHASLALLRQLL